MANFKGSKDGHTWEELMRRDYGSSDRFSGEQAIKNLALLQNWCEKKRIELTEKTVKDKKPHKPEEINRR